MLKNIPVLIVRNFIFIISIIGLIIGYLIYPVGDIFWLYSRIIVFLSFIGLSFSFTYQINEYPLKIHQLIERKTNSKSTPFYLKLILLLAFILLIGAYISFKNIYEVDYLNKGNFDFQLTLIPLLSLMESFWKRRKILKNKVAKE